MPRDPYPCAECWRPVPWHERLYRIGVRAYVCEACYEVRRGTYQLPLLATGLDVITGEDDEHIISRDGAGVPFPGHCRDVGDVR